jgi:hypothetical protein
MCVCVIYIYTKIVTPNMIEQCVQDARSMIYGLWSSVLEWESKYQEYKSLKNL